MEYVDFDVAIRSAAEGAYDVRASAYVASSFRGYEQRRSHD
jgi:hypothetical protein